MFRATPSRSDAGAHPEQTRRRRRLAPNPGGIGAAVKVLLGNSWFTPAVGGIENYLLNVGRTLVGLGHEVTVLASQHEPDLPLQDRLDGIEVRRYPFREWDAPFGPLTPFRRIAACRRAVRSLLRETSFDVAWIRDFHTAAAILSCRRHPPVVYIQAVATSLYLRRAYRPAIGGSLRWRVYARLNASTPMWLAGAGERLLLQSCHRRIVLSRAKRRELAGWFRRPESDWEVIPAGVDLSRYRPADPATRTALRVRLGLPADAFLFLYVGRFTPEKNAAGLLDAFRRLGPSPKVALALVGPHSDAAAAEAKAADFPGPVVLPGSVIEPAEWYQAADALVLPSLTEGFGQVLLEAMATGLPVVAYRPSPGDPSLATDEVVEDGVTGLLTGRVPGDDLATAMSKLAADPPRAAAMGAAGRQRCERDYSWDRVVQRLLADPRERGDAGG